MPSDPRPYSLDAILADARRRVRTLDAKAEALHRRAAATPTPRPFPTVGGPSVGIIAEVKRRSPSQGAIRPNLDPATHAEAYVRAGAVAISVLTDTAHFGGSIEDLEQVVAAVPAPVLRKDFILGEAQIVEARAAGASAVLLIARVLPREQLARLAQHARDWQLTPLIEVHEQRELEAALAAGPGLLGVNARDLATFSVDMRAAERLVARMPATMPVVAESGVETRSDVERYADAGADFVLVGSSVARSAAPEQAVRELTGVRRRGRSR